MSILFFDGFDFYNNIGPGGRKWDQGSSISRFTGGRWGAQAIQTADYIFSGQWDGLHKTLPSNHNQVIIGTAMRIDTLIDQYGRYSNSHPLIVFKDNGTVQCSLRLDPYTGTLSMFANRGQATGDAKLCDSGFVPPLTLWFYIEIHLTIGSPGAIEIRINGQTATSVTGVQTQQTGNNTINEVCITSFGHNGLDWVCDDLYVLDPGDGLNNVDFLGEVRVQTKYPDAEGYEDDFFPSITQQTIRGVLVTYQNFNMVNTPVIDYNENGFYNFSGTVGALDLYSIGNFTVSGQIFAVQENISFRKDDVGNRAVTPLLRTASQNYEGDTWACYSSYTWAGKTWEVNPATGNPWALVDLNQTDFGIKVKS
jgi:hypothetical protein